MSSEMKSDFVASLSLDLDLDKSFNTNKLQVSTFNTVFFLTKYEVNFHAIG
jgi:hypothetical protein